MNILLIQAYQGRKEPPALPLGLAYIAAHVQGHRVSIFDPNIYENGYERMQARISEYQPDIIGVSLRNVDTTQFSDPFYYFEYFPQFVRCIRETLRSGMIVVGGSGFSLYPQEIMKKVPEIDVGVYLEGEQSFAELVGNRDSVECVKGLFIRKDGAICYTGDRNHVDFASLFSPAFHLLRMDRYVQYSKYYSVGVQTKRGCVVGCAYCVYPVLNGCRLRLRDPLAVVNEIEMLVRDHKADFIFFADSAFNVPLQHAEAICNEIIRRKLKIQWTAYHNEKYVTPEYVKVAIRSGCARFSFSPDAYSERSLKALNKKIRVHDIQNSVEIMRKHSEARVSYNFFLISPETDLRSFIKLILFSIYAKAALRSRLLRLRLSLIRIEPKAPIFSYAVANGIVKEEDARLPHNRSDIISFYYRKSPSKLVNLLVSCYLFLDRLKVRVKKSYTNKKILLAVD